MPFLSLRQWWNRVTLRPAHRDRRRPRARQCFLEMLEERVVPSNTYHVTLPGDSGAADASDSTGLSGDIRYAVNQADLTQNAGSTILFTVARTGPTITLTHN